MRRANKAIKQAKEAKVRVIVQAEKDRKIDGSKPKVDEMDLDPVPSDQEDEDSKRIVRYAGSAQKGRKRGLAVQLSETQRKLKQIKKSQQQDLE